MALVTVTIATMYIGDVVVVRVVIFVVRDDDDGQTLACMAPTVAMAYEQSYPPSRQRSQESAQPAEAGGRGFCSSERLCFMQCARFILPTVLRFSAVCAPSSGG